jgi:hypothetical protein
MTVIPMNEQYRIQLDSHSWQVSRFKLRGAEKRLGVWEGFA